MWLSMEQAWPTFLDTPPSRRGMVGLGKLLDSFPCQEVTRRQHQRQNEGLYTTKQGTSTSLWGHSSLLGGRDSG